MSDLDSNEFIHCDDHSDHELKWQYVVSNVGIQFCLPCALAFWRSEYESDYKKKYLLNMFFDVLKISNKLTRELIEDDENSAIKSNRMSSLVEAILYLVDTNSHDLSSTANQCQHFD